jgi:hypothetical protein
MNWDNPEDRAALVQQIGVEAYNKAYENYIDESTVSIVGGHKIRPVNSRFGKLFNVGNTGRAFQKQSEAEKYASENPII